MNETLEKQRSGRRGTRNNPVAEMNFWMATEPSCREKIWVDLGHGTADDQRLIEDWK